MTHPTIAKEQVEKLARDAGYKHPDAVGDCEDFEYFDLDIFAEAIYKLGRNAGLEEAKQIAASENEALWSISGEIAASIESLKDNTP
jgi:hypothetical protein